MLRPKKRQALARQAIEARHNHGDSIDPSDSENDENVSPNPPPLHPATKPKSMKAQIVEKDLRITELESITSALRNEVSHLQSTVQHVKSEHTTLLEKHRILTIANRSLVSLKRKAETNSREELARRQKRIRRLERESNTKGRIAWLRFLV
ncbi:hypothetical protein B0H13DRAFT_1906688 [Mycena leptocephala]|nr:hypothetical protein B0H13DRAFT_1906688 [Mycena leptocephala]